MPFPTQTVPIPTVPTPSAPAVSRGRARRGRLLMAGLPVAVLLGGGAMLAVGVAPAAAAPAVPQLSIAVKNSSASVKPGDKLAYTITVTNLGAKKLKDLWVTQTVPAGSGFVSADGGGRHQSGSVRWKVAVEPAKSATIHATMTVAKSTPKDLLRLATVACARVTTSGPPVVCAADSDQLPAGATAEAADKAADKAAAQAAPPRPAFLASTSDRLVAGGSAAAVLLAVLAAVGLQRRRADALAPGRRTN